MNRKFKITALFEIEIFYNVIKVFTVTLDQLMQSRLIGNTCLYIHSAKLKKRTYMYDSLQFPVESTLEAVN